MSILDKLIGAVSPPETREQRAVARARAQAAADPGDWLSMIIDHHERIERAFAQVKTAADPEMRRQALRALGALLTGHAMAEEAVIYPAVADAGKVLSADMAYIEQVSAKMQMAALENLDPGRRDFLDHLSQLEAAVRHHVYEEENDWFIELKAAASPEVQARIAARYKEEFDRYMLVDQNPTPAADFRPAESRSFQPPA